MRTRIIENKGKLIVDEIEDVQTIEPIAKYIFDAIVAFFKRKNVINAK